MSAFDRLISQIDAFIRKFYKNQLLKGLLLFLGVFLLTYLAVITLEYFGRFNSAVRASLFFGFLFINIFIFGKYILNPTLKLRSFGKRINRYQASVIIGNFFPNVSDRLLNTLQLSDRMDKNAADYELLLASVNQRSESLSVIPFSGAIDLGENKRYLLWILPVIMVMFLIGIFSPSLYQQGTTRVVNFTEEFPVEAPFEFQLLSKTSGLEEGEDLILDLSLKGDALPEKVYVRTSQGVFLMTTNQKNRFTYTLPQVVENTTLVFEAPYDGNTFKSDAFAVKVDAKAAIGKLQATLIFPKYLGRSEELIENASDLTIPEGTEVIWSGLTKNSKGIDFWINNDKTHFKEDGFKHRKRFLSDAKGKVVLKNRFNGRIDSMVFAVDVIKDEFPSINVEEVSDTLKDGIRYFSGLVGDDYGVSGLNFHYTIKRKDGTEDKKSLKVSNVFGTQSPFDFAVDFRREKVQLEDKIEYFFVVTDNDGVNGGKSTKSRMFVYELPTLDELQEERSKEQLKEQNELTDLIRQADEFRKNLEHLRKETINSSRSDWNKSNQIEQLKEQHQSMIQQLETLQEEMQNSIEEKNQLSEVDKELLEQQEMIEDLLDQLMDDELKDLLDQLQDLLDKQNQEALDENMDKLEMSSEEMKDQLDRTLEMLKKMHVNEKIDDFEKALKELAKEQDELREDIENQGDITEEHKDKQKEIDEKFEDLKKDLQEIDSLNSELDRPMELGNTEEKSEEVSDELNDANQNLDKNKQKKAGENQKNASKKMNEMADDLNAMQAQSNQEQQQEDIDMLRNILESLVTLSFDQEMVMQKLSSVSDTDPAYMKYGRQQRRIISDTKIVRDSLNELAKRQPKIATFIDKELNQIKVNHELSVEDIDERRRRDLSIHQQYAMTSYNNLALMLNESLQQMQQKMKSMMPGSGSCNNPGGSGMAKPGEGMDPGNMKEMLKKQLEQMQKGQNPGGDKEGEKPGQKPGSKGMGTLGMGNKQLAKMAAEQSAIRKHLEQMKKELNKDGSGSGNKLNPLIEELEKQEKDIINKRLDDNLINRQKEILTRLLESEKALMERGFDEKRESKEGKNEKNGNQIRFDEYNKEKLKQIELLRSVDPAYNKYYKDRANEYFNRML